MEQREREVGDSLVTKSVVFIKQNYESTLQNRTTFTSSFASFSNGNKSSAEFPNEPDLHRTSALKSFTLKNNLNLLSLLNKTGSV